MGNAFERKDSFTDLECAGYWFFMLRWKCVCVIVTNPPDSSPLPTHSHVHIRFSLTIFKCILLPLHTLHILDSFIVFPKSVLFLCRCNLIVYSLLQHEHSVRCVLCAVDCLDPSCSNNGICVSGECHCKPGWGGTHCELPRAQCPDQCHGHGAFIPDSGLCSCDPNWMGPDCSIG